MQIRQRKVRHFVADLWTGAVAVVLTGLYLWRHDLWANIIAHIAVDGAGLITLALQTHKPAH